MRCLRPSIGPWLVAALLAVVALPGCGGAGGGSDDFSQEFEQPATPPPAVQDPPDTGDDLSPRERRARQQ